MLRSVYKTAARFVEGDNQTQPLEWYFVPDDTPWLPVPSVINSLNWLDAKKRIYTGPHAGEIAGLSRPYSKESLDGAQDGDHYCGTPDDWLGNGAYLDVPSDLDENGLPLCCSPADTTGNADLSLWFPWYWAFSNTGQESNNPVLYRFSSLAYDMLLELCSPGAGTLPWNIDLYYAIPNDSGTQDLLTDFALCDFPGYQQLQFYAYPPSYDGGIMMQIIEDYIFTLQDDTIPYPYKAKPIGAVCSDQLGLTLWMMDFGREIALQKNGDQVDVQVNWSSQFDVP